MKPQICVIVLNWNEKKLTEKCVQSLQAQTLKPEIIIVENGSTDGSYEYLSKKFPKITILRNSENLGFSGGENTGIRHCLENDAEFIVLLNNDAEVEKNWIKQLYESIKSNSDVAVVTGKLLKLDGKTIDSTSDQYSSWGLPIARQRGKPAMEAHSEQERVFGGTAGASMYRAKALREVGLFDEKFFAYYEDTDLNMRLQLGGWKALYEPRAVGYHAIGGTSGKLTGFTTMQTTKNLPMLFFKDMPLGLWPKALPRFTLAYCAIVASSIAKGRGRYAIKGVFLAIKNSPHTLSSRRQIQKSRKVTNDYVWSILYHDLPPDAYKLRRLRGFFTGKS